MKKIYIGIAAAVVIVIAALTFFKMKDSSLDKVIEKVKAYDKYALTCNMEMVENDELKSYLVNVSYLKEKKNEKENADTSVAFVSNLRVCPGTSRPHRRQPCHENQ